MHMCRDFGCAIALRGTGIYALLRVRSYSLPGSLIIFINSIMYVTNIRCLSFFNAQLWEIVGKSERINKIGNI